MNDLREDAFIGRLCEIVNEANEAGLSGMQIYGVLSYVLADMMVNKITHFKIIERAAYPARPTVKLITEAKP